MWNDVIYLDNFVVVKESDTFYGVYQKWYKNCNEYSKEHLITSGTSMSNALKKAKLLQIGYDSRKDEEE